MSRQASQRSSAAWTAALLAALAAAFLSSCGQRSEEQKSSPTQAEQPSGEPTPGILEKQAHEKVTPETSVAESTQNVAKPQPAKAAKRTERQPPKPQKADQTPKVAGSGSPSNPLGTLLKAVDQALKDKQQRAKTQAEGKVHVPAIGEMAPEIEGEDIDGVPFKLSDYRGNVVVLDFWGDW